MGNEVNIVNDDDLDAEDKQPKGDESLLMRKSY
jgi:hypothetical protein